MECNEETEKAFLMLLMFPCSTVLAGLTVSHKNTVVFLTSWWWIFVGGWKVRCTTRDLCFRTSLTTQGWTQETLQHSLLRRCLLTQAQIAICHIRDAMSVNNKTTSTSTSHIFGACKLLAHWKFSHHSLDSLWLLVVSPAHALEVHVEGLSLNHGTWGLLHPQPDP